MSKARRFVSMLASATLGLTCFLFAPPAHASGRAECRSIQSKLLGRPVPYCVLLPPSYDTDKARSFPVLYSLHGLGGNEQELINSGGWDLIQDLWEKKQIGEFAIVTPAGDRSFYINSLNGKTPYEAFLTKEFFPFIEAHYRISAGRRNRGITGVSMGGYGALRLALRYPQLFGSVSAHSAALIAQLPRANFDTSSDPTLRRVLGSAFGVPFDAAFWDRNNPFTIVRNGPPPVGLKIYFDCGTEDEFGFYRGAQAFHDLLASRKILHEFHLYPGGHDWSYFAEHFPASLEFHSRAFGFVPPAK